MALLAALQHCEKGEFAAAQQLYEECVDGTPPPIQDLLRVARCQAAFLISMFQDLLQFVLRSARSVLDDS